MDFIEEKTPQNISIKIFLDKWQFLAFDPKGNSIYSDNDGRSLLHKVPKIIFVGKNFSLKKEFNTNFHMLKIRNSQIIIPYNDTIDKKVKYIFIQTDKNLDLIPARLEQVNSLSQLVKDYEPAAEPDYIIADDDISPNDALIIKSRYKINDVIYASLANNYSILNFKINELNDDSIKNINMMSNNPVFLAGIHLSTMDLSKVNQLLLDFDLTALDTDFIIYYISDLIEKIKEDPTHKKNIPTLVNLMDSFKFYQYLMKKDEENIKKMINVCDDKNRIAIYRTLISKVKSIFPGTDEQILYTEFENLIMDRQEQLPSAIRK